MSSVNRLEVVPRNNNRGALVPPRGTLRGTPRGAPRGALRGAPRGSGSGSPRGGTPRGIPRGALRGSPRNNMPRGNIIPRGRSVRIRGSQEKIQTRNRGRTLPSIASSPTKSITEATDVGLFYKENVFSTLCKGLCLPQESIDQIKAILNAAPPLSSSIESHAPLLVELIRNTQLFLKNSKQIHHVVTIQKAWRSWSIRRKYRSVRTCKDKELLKTRASLVGELLVTEQNFVESLQSHINHYVLELRHTNIIQPHEGAYLFSNIETVHIEHKKLCKKLEEANRNTPFIGNIGKIFLDLGSLLNAISVYVENFKPSINELARITQENQAFAEFIDQVANETDMELSTSLLLPVNRISQYEFHLRQLADSTPMGTREKEDCENAFAAMAQSSTVVQTCLVASADSANIIKVQRKLRTDKGPLSLMERGRKVFKEFTFKKNYVCLFSDVLLIAKINTFTNKALFKHKGTVPYDKTKLISDHKNFELVVEGVSFKLSPVQPEDKTQFIQAYTTIMDEINRIKIFNVPLIETIIQEEKSTGVPSIVEITTAYIKEKLVKIPGIFREAGLTTEIQTLRDLFDSGEKDLTKLKLAARTPFSVCDILKLYFRSLPEPLLGFALYEPIVTMMRDSSMPKPQKLKTIRESLYSWTPPFALNVLRVLMTFLREVAKYSEENMMTTNNLSIVFGPTLLWSEQNTLEAAMDMPYVNGAVKLIIENYDTIITK